MYKLLAAYVSLVLKRRSWFIALVGVVSLISALSLTNMIFATSVEGLFFGPDHPQFKRYKTRINEFGGDELIIVAVESDAPLSPPNLQRLNAARAKLKAMPEVKRVLAIDDVSRVRTVDGAIKVERFGEELLKDPSREAAIMRALREDEAIAGRLLARGDRGDFIVIVELAPKKDRAAEQGPQLIRQVVEALTAEGFARERLHLAGSMVGVAEIVHQSQLNLSRLLPVVLVLLLIAVFLMFGRLWPVIVNTLAALFAVLWVLGLAIWQDPHFSIMLTLVPCFILIISFSDVVHICSAYLLELDHGKPKDEAIIAACADVGEACLMTSATTAVGFFSMMLIPTPVFERLGFVSGVGVVAAYFLALTVVPIALHYIPAPEGAWDEGKIGAVQRIMDRLLAGLARLTSRHPWPIIAAFAALTALFGYGVNQIYFETEFNQRLDAKNPVRVDERFIRERFDNPKVFDLYIEVEQPGQVMRAATFERIAALEAKIEADPMVDNVVGVVDLLRTTHEAIIGDEVELPFLPTDDERLAQTLELLQLEGVDALSQWMDFGRKVIRLTIYANDSGIRAQYALAQKIERMAKAELGDVKGLKVEVLGFEPLLGSWVDNIIEGQKRGVLVSLAIIAVLLVLGFGSLRIGLLSMIPNVLPLLALGGLAGLIWDRVDTDTLIIAMIAIGIGVDDTIHFMSRYKLERGRGQSAEAAILATFRFSGRGIVITTFIFAVGFLPLWLSEYSSIANMGSLLPYTFVIAVLADLLLVPAMISVGLLDFGAPAAREAAEQEDA